MATEIETWDPNWISTLEPPQLFDELVQMAVSRGFADVFIVSGEEHIQIKGRRYGVLEHVVALPLHHGTLLINLIKSTADMDLADKMRPQDGRLFYQSNDDRIDIRVNSIGCLHGEDVCLRILDRRRRGQSLGELGLEPKQLQSIKAMLDSPSGLMLFAGPTGCGKTTTIYACLDYLNDGTRMITTIEDPVEYELPGVRQIQVHPKRDLGFGTLLRGALRQSPDVIVIGEIRDQETAEIAVRASNSGHLVLSSVHASSAVSVVQAMLAHGASSYFLASTLLGVISQRLIRRLNPDNRVAYDLFDSGGIVFDGIQEQLGAEGGASVYGPAGGADDYIGLTGMFEMLIADRDIRQAISSGLNRDEIQELAVSKGMVPLRQAALLKLGKGITSVEEIAKHMMSDESDW
ncbi:MAG: type II secretory ATPase GspE/PulE/Tfp pilus assembly ATPase PilB-like protein [Pirellulaceae bacterium]|jgi:type II secretory ATPase GspE/PulE/Tfp pilus assembly ATPase PilB-like protein